MEILAADDPTAFAGLTERMVEQAGVVALVADRDLSRGGVEVQFFGHPAPHATGSGRARAAHGGRAADGRPVVRA